MITFGFISSVFDYMTFAMLLWLDVSVEQFRTAWFVESVASAALIVFVVRSSKPVFSSRPGAFLTAATLAIVALTVSLPYTPIANLIGFEPLPPQLLALIGTIVVLYLATAEIAKHIFYRE